MREKVVPMIHVPDVRATVEWYQGVGFKVLNTYDDGGDGLSFAILLFGHTEVMFNSGGQPSTQRRREVDLYVNTQNIDELFESLRHRVDVVEGPHDTFYGMREFIIRDLNRFWITFAQESVFARLITAVQEGNTELVRNELERGSIKAETLAAALAAASSGDHKNVVIAEMLKKAGAVSPPEVVAKTLQSYVGKYTGPEGLAFNVTLKDGVLFAATGSQPPLSLMAVDELTFRPLAFDNYGTIKFNVEAGKTIGCALTLVEGTIQLQREESID